MARRRPHLRQRVRHRAVQILLPGKFTALHPLVPGKNAKVFRARNSLLGREVFLKLYPIPATDAGSALREPQLLTELEHENLAKIYSAERLDDGNILLEMELITGGSFHELIDRSIAAATWPSIHDCIHLISDVAAGLSHLAKKGFVHRDVKPANLVMRVSGSKRQGVVTDLGLASTIAEGGRAFASRHARIYRPPEVWAGEGYSHASDVYQLTIVLFQLLGGGLNHELGNLTDDELAELAAEGRIIDPSAIGADVDTAIRRVIKKGVSAEVDRYSSMSEFLVALNNAKLHQLDWTYSVVATGFMLERKVKGNTYRVEVEVTGDRYRVTRSKAGSAGVFRRKHPVRDFRHANIGGCREFRRFIAWS